MTEWVAVINPYRHRRKYEEAETDFAHTERPRHEWRVRKSRVPLASGDVGQEEVCGLCNAKRLLTVDERGRRRVFLVETDPEFCS
jgi:hypothetical protein